MHSLRWPTAPTGVAVDAVDAAVEAAEAAAVAGAAEAAAMVAAMAVPRPRSRQRFLLALSWRAPKSSKEVIKVRSIRTTGKV